MWTYERGEVSAGSSSCITSAILPGRTGGLPTYSMLWQLETTSTRREKLRYDTLRLQGEEEVGECNSRFNNTSIGLQNIQLLEAGRTSIAAIGEERPDAGGLHAYQPVLPWVTGRLGIQSARV